MRALFNTKKVVHFTIIAGIFSAVLVAALFAAQAVEQSDMARSLVANFGYLGVLMVAVVAGLNTLIPVPAVTFVPIFLAGGLSMYLIVTTLVVGTLIADLIGYYLGRFGSTFVTAHYPGTYERIRSLHERRAAWLPIFVFLFAAFVPFPNEAYLVPLGIIGVSLKRFIVPIILGTIVHITLTAYGVENIFRYFF